MPEGSIDSGFLIILDRRAIYHSCYS
uniref:Uncharacterized protein n=1 Tax=Arundo donax TaxID=35708 RepID=A0A0A9AMW7_ARUDO